MIGDVARAADPGIWPTIGFLIFVGLFLIAVVWIYRPGRKRELEALRRLPFQDDQPFDARNESSKEVRP